MTNGLDPRLLSARQVCELYRRRWRIEAAFLLTKRVLALAYLWKASAHGIQLQLYATLLFSTVLLGVCQHVAQCLHEPRERISVELVFRAFYHYSRALERGEAVELVPYLGPHAALLGLIKRWRKRHRERQQVKQIVWATAYVVTSGPRRSPTAGALLRPAAPAPWRYAPRVRARRDG